MSFFTVDDQMHSHDKTLELVGSSVGRQAIGLWAVAGSWCGGHPETMGAISLKRIRALGFTQKHAEALESVRFWDKTPDGWVIHNWNERRPNDKRLAKRREDTRNRVRKHRENQDCNALPVTPPGKDGHALPGPSLPDHSVPIRTVPNPTGGVAPGSPTPGRLVLEAFAEAYTTGTGRREFAKGIDSATASNMEWLRVMRDKCGGDVEDFKRRIAAQMNRDATFSSGCGIRWWATTAMDSPAEVPGPKKGAEPAPEENTFKEEGSFS